MSIKDNEPVTIVAALTAAVQATFGILLVTNVDPNLIASLQAAAVAWIAFGFMWVRNKVTPVANVALTKEQLKELDPFNTGLQ